MMVRGVFSSLGVAAVSLSGLLMLADSAAAQREGEGRREGEARRDEGRREGQARRDEGRREGEARRDEGRREGQSLRDEGRREGRSESVLEGGRYDRGYIGDRGYWGYDRGYWGGYGYGPSWGSGRNFGYRPYRGYSYGNYGDSGWYGADGYYDDGSSSRSRRFLGRRGSRRGGDYYGADYSYGGGCYGSGCTGGHYGAGCTGGYYGAGCTGGHSSANSESAYGAMASPDRAVITVKVPAGAEISFDDFKTTQTGSDRQFITPALEAKRNFSYQVKAHWMDADRPVDQTRKITVKAGGQLTVDFTQPEKAGQQAEGRGEDIKAPRRSNQNAPAARNEDTAAPKPSEQNASEARAEDKGQTKIKAPRRSNQNAPAARNEDTAAPKRSEQNASEARAEDKGQTKTHEGHVVRFANHELVMKDADGKEHKHTLAKDAKITIDGKEAKAEDLKPNMKIEVTTAEADMKSALRIEAKSSE